MSFWHRDTTGYDRTMMCRIAVTALLTVLPAASACLQLPGGDCDEYDQGHRVEASSCNPEGKLTTTRTTGCSDPGGPSYTTTTTACSFFERCVAEDRLTAACLHTCVTDAECQPTHKPFCRNGYCVLALVEGADCSNPSQCAPGLSCSSTIPDASTTDARDGGDLLCAEGHPVNRRCKCR